MKEKLSKIILPYLLISIGFLLTYSSFYWLVFIRLKIIDLNDNIFGLFVPYAISAILIWFYFRKKLRLLDITNKHRDFTLFISWVLLATPIWVFQFYLKTEMGELTHIKSVSEILNNKQTMYYSIENSSQHKNKSGLYISKGQPGRESEIGIACYFACPLTEKDDSIYDYTIWIGTIFGNKFSNRVFDDKARQAKLITEFIDSSIKLYDKYEYKTTFLRLLSNSDQRDKYLKAIHQTNLPIDTENLVILVEETGTYQSRTGTSLWWTFFFIITSNLTWTLTTIFTKIKHDLKKNAL